jgi:hypothetical protein
MKLATEVERATIVRRSIFGAEIIEAVPVQAIRKDFHVLLGLFDRSTEILPSWKEFPPDGWRVPDRDAARTRMPCPYRPERARSSKKMIQAHLQKSLCQRSEGHRLFSICSVKRRAAEWRRPKNSTN